MKIHVEDILDLLETKVERCEQACLITQDLIKDVRQMLRAMSRLNEKKSKE